MSPMRPVQTLKVIGTISLGILTGTLISTPLVTVPALLSLSNSSSASRAYDISVRRVRKLTTTLSFLAAGLYTATLILARKKHPYLIYSGVLSAAAGTWSLRDLIFKRNVVEDGFEYLDVENAEVIKDRILGLRDWIGMGFAAVGFGIAVVGGYGEGFTD